MLESLLDLVEGLSIAVTPTNILYCFIGCMVGMLVGVLPGIGPSEATALLIPLSYGLDSVTASSCCAASTTAACTAERSLPY